MKEILGQNFFEVGFCEIVRVGVEWGLSVGGGIGYGFVALVEIYKMNCVSLRYDEPMTKKHVPEKIFFWTLTSSFGGEASD